MPVIGAPPLEEGLVRAGALLLTGALETGEEAGLVEVLVGAGDAGDVGGTK